MKLFLNLIDFWVSLGYYCYILMNDLLKRSKIMDKRNVVGVSDLQFAVVEVESIRQ